LIKLEMLVSIVLFLKFRDPI